MAKTKTMNVSNPAAVAAIPGMLKGSYVQAINGEKITFYFIEVESNYLNAGAMDFTVTGAVVNVSEITYIPTGNSSRAFTAHNGDVLVITSKKAHAFITGFTNKELSIIQKYEGIKAFLIFLNENEDSIKTNLSIEESAIEFMADSCQNLHWRSTVINALKRYDESLRKFEKKYYKKYLKNTSVKTPAIASAKDQQNVPQDNSEEVIDWDALKKETFAKA